MGSVTINDKLPTEILCEVFSYLPIDNQVLLADVCQHWRQVIYDIFARKKSLNFCSTSQDLIDRNRGVFRSVETLNIYLSAENIPALPVLLANLPSLTTLQLHAGDIQQVHWGDVESGFQHLASPIETLELYSHSNHFPFGILRYIIETSSESLRHFLCYNQNLYGGYFQLITGSFPNLETLDLSSCRVDDQSKLASRFASLPELRHLNLRGSNIHVTDGLLESLGENCGKLEYFVISSVITASVSSIEALSKCAHLKEIKANCDVSNSNVHFIAALPNRVTLHCQAELVRASILKLANAVTLEALHLSNNMHVTDDILQVLASKLANLRKVDLSNCQGVTNLGVSCLALSLDRLKDISVTDVRNIDTQLIEQIAEISRASKLTINVRGTQLAKQWKEMGQQRWGYYGLNGNIQIFS